MSKAVSGSSGSEGGDRCGSHTIQPAEESRVVTEEQVLCKDNSDKFYLQTRRHTHTQTTVDRTLCEDKGFVFCSVC